MRAPVRRIHRSEEGASRELLLPGNPRVPGLREAALRRAPCSGPQVKQTRVTRSFSSDFEKMSIDESNIRKIIAEVQATTWRLRECIRARKLAATHRLGQMCRLRMLEEQTAWKREAGFDHIETAAEMDAQRFRTNLVLEPFYSKVFNPRWPHTPDEFTFKMRVDVERLRMEIVLSQPEPPSQCDPSPRRLPVVDTRPEEPETPRRSSAIGTGSDEPGVSRAKERDEKFPLQASVNVFLRFNCTSLDQEDTIILLLPNVGVDHDKDQPTTSQQATVREEFARPTKKR